MQRHGVCRLLVLGDDGRAVEGVLSMDDLLGVLADELAALAATLRVGLAREEGPALAAREAR